MKIGVMHTYGKADTGNSKYPDVVKNQVFAVSAYKGVGL